MEPHRPITQRKQLLVEGRTPELFFRAMISHLKLQEIELHDFGGYTQLRPFLKAFCARPEFKENVHSLGIVRDAEFTVRVGEPKTEPQTVDQAFASVCGALESADQQVPAGPGVFTTAARKIGVFILPNCRDPGMLETLCLESVHSPQIDQCIEQYFACMARAGHPQPANMTKAKTFAFLAAKEIYDPLVGRAAQKGIWPWQSPVFKPLEDFLLTL